MKQLIAGVSGLEVKLKISRAVISDLEEINFVITSAKQVWGYSEDSMELWLPDLLLEQSSLLSREFWVLKKGITIVGLYSLSEQSKGIFELEDCWVLPAYMGQGLGEQLFDHAVKNLQSLAAFRMHIVSDPNACDFYKKMGANCVGEQPSKPKGRYLPVLELNLQGRP
ncbi:GNAT family N-acetyltransferase [Photobacterium sagamiensis]|uniref:GNAT family N-acetyltransferase n=1 Tax=Photobacterium sagamiensis TaxID=2910241 RepID=UPI003D0C187D